MFVVIFVVALLLLSLLIIAYVLPRPLLSLIQSTTGVLFFFQENSLSSQPQEIIEEKMEEEEDSHERSSQVIGKKVVYLTIDDAPSSSTPDILRVLEKYGVSASFFIISGDFVDCAGEEEDEMQEFLEQTEEAHLTSSSLSPSPSPPSSSQQREFIRRVKAISEAGHELCNHTQREEGTAFLGLFFFSLLKIFSLLDLFLNSTTDQQTMEESINHCSRTIQTITGKPPRFFRPGSGWFHQSMLSYAAQVVKIECLLKRLHIFFQLNSISNLFIKSLSLSPKILTE